jgi:hypothetical protein
MKEALLHSVWRHRLYASGSCVTDDGKTFEVVDAGLHNTNGGPDFFNAKIKIDNQIWVGNIEIHARSSDWYKHGHDKDKAYSSVILHIVEFIDRKEIQTENGRLIPQWEMKIPPHIEKNYLYLTENIEPVPCLPKIKDINELYLIDWKNALLTERLERKTNTIFQLLNIYQNDWNEVFYICLARNFGFGINNDAFERLAKSLPLKYIYKHQDSGKQVEALFLGQAGLLEKEETEDEYFTFLREEYRFLKKKYNLQSLESHIFKNLRIRPNNFPHVKIVQLAGLVRKAQCLFSKIISTEQLSDFQSILAVDTENYWQTHYHFGKETKKTPKNMGMSAINILLINTVIPVLFAYGKNKNNEKLQDKALQLLAEIKAERNFIITLFSRAGIKIDNAGDSQAIIQLKREYCEKKKCMFCRIGYKYLRTNAS